MFKPSLSNLITEIKRLDEVVKKGLYSEGKEPFVEAIGTAREACCRAQKAAHRVCLSEGTCWPGNAIIGFAKEIELLDQLIKVLAVRVAVGSDDIEAAEITRAISDAEVAVAEAHDLVESFAMPETVD